MPGPGWAAWGDPEGGATGRRNWGGIVQSGALLSRRTS